MEGIAYILLLVAVSLTSARGDKNCFYNKISECVMQNMGQTTPIFLPVDFSLCEYRKQLFTCVHKKLKKCSVDQKYDFSDLENLYHDICTEGTPLNEQMHEHSDCYKDAVLNLSTCSERVMDIFEKAEDVDPDFITGIHKKICKEGRHIIHCYYGVIEEKCGKAAREFAETVFKASENLNKAFCEDILNDKITVAFY